MWVVDQGPYRLLDADGSVVRSADDTARLNGGIDLTWDSERAVWIPTHTGYASNSPPEGPRLYQWKLRTQCQIEDAQVGACTGGVATCTKVEGRIISRYYVERYRLVQADYSAVDGQAPSTTEGQPVTFTAVQAHAVLTDPYD